MLIHMHTYVFTSTQRFVFKFILTSRITLFASKELSSNPYLYITNKKRPSCRQLVHIYIFQKSIYSLATIVLKYRQLITFYKQRSNSNYMSFVHCSKICLAINWNLHTTILLCLLFWNRLISEIIVLHRNIYQH